VQREAAGSRGPTRLPLEKLLGGHRWKRGIVAFLTRKWAREQDYRLIKELWAFDDDRIVVRFAYEWRDESENGFRSFGNENWEFVKTA